MYTMMNYLYFNQSIICTFTIKINIQIITTNMYKIILIPGTVFENV